MSTSWGEQLDHLFENWNNADSPGCALGVYQEGEIIYKRGYGIAHLEHGVAITPATVFHVASLSKQFTAMAVGLLARSGLISLEDDIREYIPELRISPAVTFRQIIHHTSGLRDQWDMLRLGGWRDADIKTNGDILRLAVSQKEMNFAPGTRFQYINTGYTLMGIAIERITGKSLREYTDENMFEPLAMSSTYFHDDYRKIVKNRAQAYSRYRNSQLDIDMPAYETVGPTNLFSTVEDFEHWERNLLSPTVGDKDFIKQLLTPGALDDGQPVSYGFGFITGNYRGLETAEHAGGDAGYRAYYLRFPGERFAVAIFCNFAEINPGQLAHEVADTCLAGRFKAEDSSNQEIPAWAGRAAGIRTPISFDLDSKSGLYRDSLSSMTCRIESRGGRVFLAASAGGEYELVPIEENRFRFLSADAECFFTPATADQPVRMVVKYAGQETALCERIADEEVAPDWRADEYAGTYESEELDVRYTIELSDKELILRRAKFKPSPLVLFAKDEFSANDEGLHIRFVRNEEGRIAGLILNAERVWNVRFNRL